MNASKGSNRNDDPTLLHREIRVLVFDQYGTVVDMQTGLTEAVAPFLSEKGWQGDPHQLVTWCRRTLAPR